MLLASLLPEPLYGFGSSKCSFTTWMCFRWDSFGLDLLENLGVAGFSDSLSMSIVCCWMSDGADRWCMRIFYFTSWILYIRDRQAEGSLRLPRFACNWSISILFMNRSIHDWGLYKSPKLNVPNGLGWFEPYSIPTANIYGFLQAHLGLCDRNLYQSLATRLKSRKNKNRLWNGSTGKCIRCDLF